MINDAKKKEDLLKLRYFKGILGVLLILAGYMAGIMIKNWELDLMISSVTALLCVSMQCSNITQHHCYEDVRTSNEFFF
ncbi:hypothetical protein [Clostridium botulinum]|uniref:Uncharacterized protein n=1 Tax=Clostridium botulinum (strain Okra / Type B1) TaxID=498213 RepID=B1IE78_CLOBK|nr:hypothetical protein [Clostridium botulinum]ACA44025.1 hypothetical protein CLD_0524 [Clostridium botulinum B1 str. Okra]MCR1074472.1 hypothetical protein [Clostridium botulinum]